MSMASAVASVAFIRVATQSGLTKAELAKFYGVSRQTILHWSAGGRMREHTHTTRIAETITKALVISLDRKLLPLKVMSREERRARVTRMARTLQGLKLAPIA